MKKEFLNALFSILCIAFFILAVNNYSVFYLIASIFSWLTIDKGFL